MKLLQCALLAAVFFLVGCATTAGTWQGSAKTDAAALRADVEKSLVAASWLTYPDASGVKALKPGPGGQRTWAFFDFTPGSGGSTFNMVGKSDHVVNWLTFGILGLSLQGKARGVCTEWFEGWQQAHPTTGH